MYVFRVIFKHFNTEQKLLYCIYLTRNIYIFITSGTTLKLITIIMT